MGESEPHFLNLDSPETVELLKDSSFSDILIYELSKLIVDNEYPTASELDIAESLPSVEGSKVLKHEPKGSTFDMAGRLQDALTKYQGHPFEKFKNDYKVQILKLLPSNVGKAISEAYKLYISELNKSKKIQ